MSNLKKSLVLVQKGRIKFDQFIARTRSEFRAMAGYLMRRWTPPEWFTLDDLEQELYLGVWKYIAKFDPSRGVTLEKFIIYNAMSCAKTQLHKARGVTISGSPDRKTSNIETPLSFMGADVHEGEVLMASILSEEAIAEEELVEAAERKRASTIALKMCENDLERYTVLAIRESGSLDAAGRLLYDDIDHRITLRLNSEEHANRFVLRHARAVAQRTEVSC